MQLGGIGGSHGSGSHQVTNCMHDHTHYHKTGSSAAASDISSQAAQLQAKQQQQSAQFSLSAWVQKLLGSGKSFFGGIWGLNKTASDGMAGNNPGQAQVMAQMSENVTSAQSAVAGQSAAAAERAAVQVNPYFQEVQRNSGAAHMTPFSRVRAKVTGVAGQLTGKLAGRFSRFQAKNSFQAKSEQKPEEDLRRRSKYKKDEVEIDCILTDESYLLDSYDRKGEYSQLTTKK